MGRASAVRLVVRFSLVVGEGYRSDAASVRFLAEDTVPVADRRRRLQRVTK